MHSIEDAGRAGRLHPGWVPGGFIPSGIPGCYSPVRHGRAQALVSSHHEKVSWLGDESKPPQ